MTQPAEHRWSGWPGAWCLDCGAEDAREVCAGSCPSFPTSDGDQPCPIQGHHNEPCAEPGSRRNDPYARLTEVFERIPTPLVDQVTAINEDIATLENLYAFRLRIVAVKGDLIDSDPLLRAFSSAIGLMRSQLRMIQG